VAAIAPIAGEINQLKGENVALKQELSCMNMEIEQVKSSLDNGDQAARRNHLILTACWTDSAQTNPLEQVTSFAADGLSLDAQSLNMLPNVTEWVNVQPILMLWVCLKARGHLHLLMLREEGQS